MQREPARIAPHELDEEYAAVRRGGGVDVINDVCRDINGALEAEGRVRAPNVVIDGLGQGHDVHACVHQELCAFLRAVAAHDDEAVEIELIVGVLHRGDEAVSVLVNDVLSRDIALARGAEYRAALSEDAGKVLRLHEFIVAFYEAAISVVHAEYLEIFDLIVQSLAYAAHCRVQTLAVAARGYERDSRYILQAKSLFYVFCFYISILKQYQ